MWFTSEFQNTLEQRIYLSKKKEMGILKLAMVFHVSLNIVYLKSWEAELKVTLCFAYL